MIRFAFAANRAAHISIPDQAPYARLEKSRKQSATANTNTPKDYLLPNKSDLHIK